METLRTSPWHLFHFSSFARRLSGDFFIHPRASTWYSALRVNKLISSIFKDRKLSLDREEVEGNVNYGAEKGHNQRIKRSISKTIFLNEFIQLTRYNRCYACQILNVKKEKVLGYLNIASKRIKYVVDKKKIKRKKKKIYDKEVFIPLKEIWKICDYICSKRLAPHLEEIIPVLEIGIPINLKGY